MNDNTISVKVEPALNQFEKQFVDKKLNVQNII